jgi:hypothetical protein
MELDERKSSGPQNVVILSVYVVVEVRTAPEVVLDVTVWNIP